MDALCKYKIKEKIEIRTVVDRLICDVENTHQLSEEKTFEIRLVMNELLSNCFKYCNITPDSPVLVEYKVEEKQLHFTVSDCGTGFDVHKTHYEELGQDLFAENGRGLFLANQLSRMLRFNDLGNQVTAIIDLVN
ncbi:MAG: ATP-binding protein [Eubacteriales bacterium]